MAQISAKRVMSGTWGEVWVDNQPYAEISSFQAKISYNKTAQPMAGQMMEDTKVTSAKGTGSLTVKKVYSRLAGYGDSLLEGIDHRVTIIGKLDDPDAYGCERVALYNVSFDEEPLQDWQVGSTRELTIPFTFTQREWLEQVEPNG